MKPKYVSPPCFNDKGFTPQQKAYIAKTADDLARALQPAGIVWPTHEFAAMLSTHIHLLKK